MNQKTNIKIIALIIIVVLVVLALVRSNVASQSAAVTVVDYACNNVKTMTATYHPEGTVDVVLSDGRSMSLAQAVSADGARYKNLDESFVFWSKGNGALVLEDNKEKSYIGCIKVATEPAGSGLSQVYANGTDGISMRLPSGYKADESYKYQALGPGKDIAGVKFTIPSSVATGTNLSKDSYISVEQIPQVSDCSASLFMGSDERPNKVTDAGVTYSVGSSGDAAAGNRYQEKIFAIPGTNPCTAVRYFIHYTVLENYPEGTIKQFDEKALTAQFDAIRRTLVLNQ